jgi:hypothetical protein
MVETVLDKVSSQVDRRFLSTLLLPTCVLVAGVGALAATEVGWAPVLDRWSHLDDSRRAFVVAAALLAVLLLAMLLAANLRAIIRLYEGYWSGPLGRVPTTLGVRVQAWRRGRLDLQNPQEFAERYYVYPAAGVPLLPTRLGNAMRAAESYAGSQDRYGMDGVFFWPRLYALLPDALRAALADARAELERLVVVSMLAFVLLLVALGFAVFGTIPRPVWLSTAVGALVVALLAYRSAIGATIAYGELIRTSFDLYRRAVLAQMGLTPPATLAEERELWMALGQQLYRGASSRSELLRFGEPRKTVSFQPE